MTYSLNTLNASAPARGGARSGVVRFGHELLLLAGLALLAVWLLALLSYAPTDAAWSTSGTPDAAATHNWFGRVGAWVADVSYFTLGFSVWWAVAAALRAWLGSLGRWLRGGAATEGPWRRRGLFWPGLAVLLCASSALEWARLYRLEELLPGHAGGMLGFAVGPLAVKWLGFTGSGLVGVALVVLAMGLVFGFSWGRLAEALGSRIDAVVLAIGGLLERARDVAAGRRAAREREVAARRSVAEVAVPRSEEPVEPGPAVAAAPRGAAARVRTASAAAPVREAAGPAEPVLHEAAFAAPWDDGPGIEGASPGPADAPHLPAPGTRPAADGATAPVAGRGARPAASPQDGALPQVDLLDAAPAQQESVTPETLEMTSRLIEKKLKDFGVEVEVVEAMPGPVVTRYEIEPATGVKGSQIVNLAKDLARSLSLVSIRVVETIPGKTTMALELPNARRQTIRLAEILGSQVYDDAKSLLTVGLGKDIVGRPVVADLAKMPHCLVAGTTGSGKSVGINAMILSLLYKAEARDVRLLMIDPKMLEMSVYEGIPHLLAPVVTDMKQAAHGLNWCVAEMERRYKLMSKLGVRNLAGYNAKIGEAEARGESIGNPFSLTPEAPEPLERLPHIVVIIDELADLMMVVGKKIEELIARLAQKARAAGIHLILATQRPSVDVITGLIKANIPTRIAFQVSSKIDSRTILDQMGAEALLGMGDMLYMASGTGLPMRVHGAFVSDEEVHRVVDYLKTQGEPDYIDGVLEGASLDEEGASSGFGGLDGEGGEKDPMYDQAVEVVLKDRKASISYVQRKLRIGYNRSARLLEDMEKAGLVSALTSNGQREVLVPARPE
ncbi:S-DNA-T family DNA segregation ATPase FtsK/SpoIIIE [Melaminivora alkalimesophila]|uniref:S-DNA-T family DNA segregation ATPase FtsK/SpoIIIE n=2 Tax=Melaminivora alkalimesophila TaxID=1165852 RepID=A0A317RDM3_9BURK|nr:DNA translocase FtsK [Melaminivora alkalimesophila]PWW47671.1 S-DNA-T family DNA segregation ATPase FtsK/SpoIIIE [Melaminivora alkalimesophila]